MRDCLVKIVAFEMGDAPNRRYVLRCDCQPEHIRAAGEVVLCLPKPIPTVGEVVLCLDKDVLMVMTGVVEARLEGDRFALQSRGELDLASRLA
jgi:hypothetical protein